MAKNADGDLKIKTDIDLSGAEAGLNKLIGLIKKGASAIDAAKLGKELLDVSMSFEAGMSQVAATLGTTVTQISDLSAIAKEMGATTQYSATQATEALNYLTQAGYDASKAAAVLPDVLNLAASDSMDLGYATQMLTDSMAVLGLQESEITQYTDQLAVAAQKSNASVSQMGEGILVAGGMAKTAGLSVVDMSTALGILADNGIKGAEGGTALRNALKNLYTPTTASAEALEALGVNTVNADGSLRDMQPVLQDLNSALSDLSEGDRVRAMSQIFDTRTIAAGNALLKGSGDAWSDLAAQIDAADGAAAQMAETMNDNLQGDVTRLKSSLEALGIQIYEGMQEPLRNAAQIGLEGLQKLSGTVDFLKEHADLLIPSLAGVVASIVAFKAASTIIPIVQSLTVTWTAATGVMSLYAAGANAATVAQMGAAGGATLLGTAMAVLSGKITLATAAQTALNLVTPTGWAIAATTAIVGLAAAVVTYSNSLPKIETETERLTKDLEALSEAAEQSRQAYAETATELAESRKNTTDMVTQLTSLADNTNRTASEQAMMLEIMRQLNAEVPGLNLVYDELNGTLNMTAAQILAIADAQAAAAEREAMAARLVELRDQITKATENATAAQEAYNAALAARDEYNARAEENGFSDYSELAQITDAIREAENALVGYNNELNSSQQEYEALCNEIDNAANSTKEVGAVVVDSKAMFEDLAAVIEETTERIKEHDEASVALAKTSDDLSNALKEQSEQGSLSIDTIQQLRDDGYALALQIDEETGAVTVNRDAYIELANAKIQEQIAAMQLDRAALVSALASEAAATTGVTDAANAAALAYVNEAKALFVLKAVEDDRVSAMDAEIAALERLAGTIGQTNAARKSGGAAAKSAGKEAEKAAEDAAKAEEKAAKDAYTAATNRIKQYQQSANYLASEELAMWKSLASSYEENSKERIEIDKNTARLQTQIDKDEFTHSKNWIENRKKLNELSAADEIAAWERVSERFAEGSAFRQEAEEKLFAARERQYDDSIKLIDKMTAAEEKYQNGVLNRSSAIANSFGLFDKIQKVDPKKIEPEDIISPKNLKKNLDDQLREVEKWTDNLQTLVDKGIDENLLAELQQMGPKAGEEIAALASMDESELAEYSATWGKMQALATEQAIKELQPLRDETNAIIDDLIASLAEVADAATLKRIFGGESSEILAGLSEKIAAAKPDEIGAKIIDDTARGVSENPALNEASTQSIADVITTLATAIEQAGFPQLGQLIADGLAQGLLDGTGVVGKAAIGLVVGALAATRKAADINSPSRKFAVLGAYSAEGLGVGFEDAAPDVFDRIRKLSSDEVERTIAPAYSALDTHTANVSAARSEVGGTEQVIARNSEALAGSDIIRQQTADLANLLMALQSRQESSSASGQNVVMQIDGVTLGRVMLPYNRQAGSQSPQITTGF